MAKTDEIAALYTLIDDPDEEVFGVVSDRIVNYGTTIIPTLEHWWETTPNEQVQTRIENLIHRLQFRDLRRNFTDWKQDIAHYADPQKAFVLLDLVIVVLHLVAHVLRNSQIENGQQPVRHAEASVCHRQKADRDRPSPENLFVGAGVAVQIAQVDLPIAKGASNVKAVGREEQSDLHDNHPIASASPCFYERGCIY